MGRPHSPQRTGPPATLGHAPGRRPRAGIGSAPLAPFGMNPRQLLDGPTDGCTSDPPEPLQTTGRARPEPPAGWRSASLRRFSTPPRVTTSRMPALARHMATEGSSPSRVEEPGLDGGLLRALGPVVAGKPALALIRGAPGPARPPSVADPAPPRGAGAASQSCRARRNSRAAHRANDGNPGGAGARHPGLRPFLRGLLGGVAGPRRTVLYPVTAVCMRGLRWPRLAPRPAARSRDERTPLSG